MAMMRTGGFKMIYLSSTPGDDYLIVKHAFGRQPITLADPAMGPFQANELDQLWNFSLQNRFLRQSPERNLCKERNEHNEI